MQYFTQLFSSTSFDVLDQLKKEIMQTMNKITETYILFLRRIRDAVLNVIFFLWFMIFYVELNLAEKIYWNLNAPPK